MKKNGEFVGVDDKFIPENEKHVDESIIGNKEESTRKIKKTAKCVGIGFICGIVIIIALTIGMIIFGFSMFKNVRKTQNDMMSSARQHQNDMRSSVQQIQN